MRAPSLLLLLAAPTLQGGAGHWTYPSNAGWAAVPGAESCESGQRQSPVDIGYAEQTRLPGWQFVEYASERTGEVKNNGHTFQFSLDGSAIQVAGGGLGDRYTFAQGHFHWGNQSDRGSEHRLLGRAFPLELHLVHFNSKYGTIGEAAGSGDADALAVIGVLFSLSPKDSPYLAPLLDFLPNVKHPDGNKNVAFTSPVKLGSLLPSDPHAFYRYTGSLTTPGCNELVTWTVMHHTAGVSEAQLEALRSLQDGEGYTLGNNFREVQPFHGRKVSASGLDRPMVLQPAQCPSGPAPVESQAAMVPGWAVVVLCLAVALNVGAVAALLSRRGRGGKGHSPVSQEES